MTYRIVEVMDGRDYSQFEVADKESGEYLGSYLVNWKSQTVTVLLGAFDEMTCTYETEYQVPTVYEALDRIVGRNL